MKKRKPTEEELRRSIKKPGDVRPDQFEPRVLSTRRSEFLNFPQDFNRKGPQESRWPEYDANWVRLLVCWKRLALGPLLDEAHPIPDLFPTKLLDPELSRTHELAFAPVAIVLQHPVKVLYGFHLHTPIEHRNWIVSPVEEFSMGRLDSEAALSAAWRGVEEVVPSWPDAGGIKFGFRTPWSSLENDLHYPKDGNTYSPHEKTSLRDVALWINWTHWDTCHSKPLTIEERAAVLTRWGFPSTATAVRRVKEKVMG